MSTRAQMMAELATIFDRPKSSVEAVDRVLTDAGLRTRAARGRAAQAMSAEDFANVTIGLMGGWSLRETPVMVARLGALELWGGEIVEFDLGEDGEMMGIRGSADLTAHVDFEILAQATPSAFSRLTPQGVFLERLGITARAQTLARGRQATEVDAIATAQRRLTHPEEMGNLFKVLGFFPESANPPPGLDT